MKKFRVIDTITFERVWYVEAIDEDDARRKVESGNCDSYREEQIGNTPFDVEVPDE